MYFIRAIWGLFPAHTNMSQAAQIIYYVLLYCSFCNYPQECIILTHPFLYYLLRKRSTGLIESFQLTRVQKFKPFLNVFLLKNIISILIFIFYKHVPLYWFFSVFSSFSCTDKFIIYCQIMLGFSYNGKKIMDLFSLLNLLRVYCIFI